MLKTVEKLGNEEIPFTKIVYSMKKFGLFLSLSLLLAFTGCSDSDDVDEQGGGAALAKPSVAVTTTTSTSFKAAWDAVAGAESYKYVLSQENETGDEILERPEASTSATSVSFDGLQPKTKYVLRVKAVAGASSGQTDSEYAKVFATTLSETPAELTFEKIAVSDPTYESVLVEIVPSAEDIYYFTVVKYDAVADKSDEQVIAALSGDINSNDLVSGNVKKTVYGLEPDTRYTVVAFGWNADKGVATSAVGRLGTPFMTTADTRMSIAITVGETNSEKASVSFVPSVAAGSYFADVVAASEVANKSDEQIVALLQAKYGAEMSGIAHTGAYTGDFAVEAGGSYTAVAFGYDTAASALTTKMATASIQAPAVSGNDYFAITVSNPTESGFDFTITPADADMYYFPAVAPAAMLDRYTLDEIGDQLLSVANQYCEQYGWDASVSYEIFVKGYCSDTWPNLSPETTYCLFVIGLEKASATSASAVTSVAVSDPITTTAASAAGAAWVDMEPVYGTSNGSYAMGVDLTPNDKTQTVWAAAYRLSADGYSLSDYDLTEDELRTMLLSDNGSSNITQNSEGVYRAALAVSENQSMLFAALGKDASGVAGEANWIILKAGSAVGTPPTILGQSSKNNSGGGSDIALKSASYSDYLGDWTLTSYGSFIVSENGVSGSKDPLTFNLRFEQNVADKSYKVYGWSTDTEFGNAHPFVMNYDPVEDNGISGWVDVTLSQTVATEGDIQWILSPRFIVGQSYYYYSGNNLDYAFFGATLEDGSVYIIGNEFNFSEIGTVEMEAMGYVGLNSANPSSAPSVRPLETAHAMAPYTMVKAGAATSSVKSARAARQMRDIAAAVSLQQNFARLSTAATLGFSKSKLLKQAVSGQRAVRLSDNLRPGALDNSIVADEFSASLRVRLKR